MLAISCNPHFIAQFPFEQLSPPSFNFSFEIRVRIYYVAYVGHCTAKFWKCSAKDVTALEQVTRVWSLFLASISSMHPVLSVAGQQEDSSVSSPNTALLDTKVDFSLAWCFSYKNPMLIMQNEQQWFANGEERTLGTRLNDARKNSPITRP